MTPRTRATTVSRRALARRGAAALWGLAILSTAAPLRAEPVRAVVEMFTSQGCAACRAADPVVRDLARRPGILALTLPVTYWDYLGWKDTLALRAFTERQRAYARARGARQVFTPQAVVDGAQFAVGSDRAALERLVREGDRSGGLPVAVRGEEAGGRIVVEVGAAAPREAGGTQKGEVWLVPVMRASAVAVGGEDGAVVSAVNVVRALRRLGPWAGQAVRFDVPCAAAEVAGADGWVVLVQGAAEGRPGRILGAAKGPGF